MSNYQREQLLTYLMGPMLTIAGMLMFVVSVQSAIETSERALGAIGYLWASIIGTTAIAHIFYGTYVIRAGRRHLASNHWRAEHFQA